MRLHGQIIRPRHRANPCWQGPDESPARRFRKSPRPACLAKQNIKAGRGARGAVNTQAGRGIALRVKVNQQNRLANGGQRRAEIDCRGGFADPPF